MCSSIVLTTMIHPDILFLHLLVSSAIYFQFSLSSENNNLNNNNNIKLHHFNISDITLSGLSAGAYFTVQFHVAYSSLISGVAVFAGGPFYCAESSLEIAEGKCMDTSLGGPSIPYLIDLTYADANLGLIDYPTHMYNDRVYLYSGEKDSVVSPTVVKSLLSYYSAFTNPINIVADFNVKAEHCFPTLDYGEECTTLGSPYIGNCKFDGAGVALKNIYPKLNLTRGTSINENLFSFDQTPYFSSLKSSIGDTGYIYIPSSCQSGINSCHLHISFHGCEQTLDLIGNQYAADTGFNSWAEENDIIVLYPYVKVSSVIPYNPKGCWDWWSYTGDNYGLKSGVQLQFVRSLIGALGGDNVIKL